MVAEMKDRKTLGLEMEGYGINRVWQITNNGNTKALIIKSLMNKTSEKNDDVKKRSCSKLGTFHHDDNCNGNIMIAPTSYHKIL